MLSALKFLPAFLTLSCANTRAIGPDPSLQDDEAIAGKKGLPVSSHVPSFRPRHLTGPNAGQSACPLCVYGLVPQLQVWVQESRLEEGIAMAESAERLSSRATKGFQFVPYGIVVPTNGRPLSEETVSRLKRTGFKTFFWTTVNSWEDRETSGLYGHSEQDKPALRLYSVVNRRLYARWDDPKTGDWPEIEAAVRKSAPFVSTYDVTDAQIAPMWEPGPRMEVRFRVVDTAGRPISGVKVSAMQTNVSGRYNPEGWDRRDASLKAMAWTDKNGLITFRTIVPGPYPTRKEPVHIHFSAAIDGKSQFRTLWFEGDPLITAERRQWADRDEETMIVPITKAEGRSLVEHSFVVKR